MTADHRQRRRSPPSAPGCAASASSPSTPSSCATAPTGPSSAWCRSPARRRRWRSTRWRPASTSRRCSTSWPTTAVLKVMHAARQDLEIFYHLGRCRAPFFDTQVAAMVCGFGEEVAYDTLVSKLAGAQLDKSSRFTDWARRPLSRGADPLRPGRRHPSAGDLRASSRPGSSRRGRTAWVAEELAGAARPRALRASRPRRPGGGSSCAPATRRFVAIVQALAAWREREAQRRDLPRARIIRDDLLMEVAANRPQSVEELRALERVNLDRESAAGVVAADPAAPWRCPRTSCRACPSPWSLPRGIGPTVDLLRVLLKHRCEEAGRGAAPDRQHGSDLEAIAVDDAGRRAGAARLAARDLRRATRWRSRRGELALAVREGRVTLARPRRRDMAPRLLIVGRGFIGRAAGAGSVVAAYRRPRRQPAAPTIDAVLWWPAATRRLGTAGVAPRGRAGAEGRPPRRRAAASPSSASARARSTHRRPSPLHEDRPLGPTDRYGRQKLALEHALAGHPRPTA